MALERVRSERAWSWLLRRCWGEVDQLAVASSSSEKRVGVPWSEKVGEKRARVGGVSSPKSDMIGSEMKAEDEEAGEGWRWVCGVVEVVGWCVCSGMGGRSGGWSGLRGSYSKVGPACALMHDVWRQRWRSENNEARTPAE